MKTDVLDLNLQLLQQAVDLIDRLDDATYTGDSSAGLNSVGCQMRHCLEFYGCFLDGLESGRINYDHRRRSGEIERSRETACQEAAQVVESLTRLSTRQMDAGLTLQEGVDEQAATCPSSISRELAFLASHTVHHLALMGAILRARGVDPGEELGVAPATLEHRSRLDAPPS